MILGDHGPTTQMEDDLQALGMDNLLEAISGTGKAKKAGTEKEAASRQDIPVRKEDEDEDEDLDLGEDDDDDDDFDEGEVPPQFKKGYKKGDKGKDDDDDDDDDDEMDEGEVPPQFKKGYKKGDKGKGKGKGKGDDDYSDEMDEDDGFDFDSLDEDATEALRDALVDYAQEQEFSQRQYDAMLEDEEFVSNFAKEFFAEDEDPKMGAAWDVIESFQEKLQAVQEGDDDARPDYDDLVGVIEAYEYLAEIRFGKKGGKVQKGKKRAMKRARAKRMGKKKARAHGRGKHFVGGKVQTTAQVKKGLRKSIKGSTGRYRKSQKEKLKHIGDVKSDVEPTDDPISELVQNLNDLREAVTQPQVEVDGHDPDEMIEGCKAIHDTAIAFYERIASELRENEEIDEDDDRVTMGRHLEALANDAQAVATAIAENEEIDMEDAADDLQNLAADLNDAMEAMKEIE